MSTIPLPSATAIDPPARPPPPEVLDRLLGPPLFYLSVAFLIFAGGTIHRLGHIAVTGVEGHALFWGLVLLWPVFILEALLRLVACRRSGLSWRGRLAGLAAVVAFPPLRLGGRSYADAEKIWLPCLGWTTVDHHLRTRLEHFCSVPMIIIAVLVLPFLALEYFWLEQVRSHFLLSLLLDLGSSIIWLAFALELIIMVAVADSKLLYCLKHWIDVAVVLLPLIDFLPLLRLTRLIGVLEIQGVGRLSRLYRLRGLLSRGWRAVLLLEMIQRLFGPYRENRLGRLRKLLAAREDEIVDLRREIAELESTLAREKQQPPCPA